jgi:hypothetical protein
MTAITDTRPTSKEGARTADTVTMCRGPSRTALLLDSEEPLHLVGGLDPEQAEAGLHDPEHESAEDEA